MTDSDEEGESTLALYAPLPEAYDPTKHAVQGEFVGDLFQVRIIDSEGQPVLVYDLEEGEWGEAVNDYVQPEIMREDPNELFPWVYRKTYHYTVELADGKVIANSFSFALDETIFNHPTASFIGFHINTEYHDPEEIVNVIGRTILEMHYINWCDDNPNNPLDFEGYLQLVADGGGQYTFNGSQEAVNVDYRNDPEFRTYRVVTADPSKPISIVFSYQTRDNIAIEAGSPRNQHSWWTVSRLDGSIAHRHNFSNGNDLSKFYDYKEKGDIFRSALGHRLMDGIRNLFQSLGFADGQMVINPNQNKYSTKANPVYGETMVKNGLFISENDQRPFYAIEPNSN